MSSTSTASTSPRPVVAVIDFGGQYAHLIVNRVRRLGVYAELFHTSVTAAELAAHHVVGIILSGGGGSVSGDEKMRDAHGLVGQVLSLQLPTLGICFGMQALASALGGRVCSMVCKEYGPTELHLLSCGAAGVAGVAGDQMPAHCVVGRLASENRDASHFSVYMSHGDSVAELPPDFVATASTEMCPVASFCHQSKHIFGVQFHPEVTHTEHGNEILKNFLSYCEASEWSMKTYLDELSTQIKHQVGDRSVFMLVSGGVDSTVAFALLDKILGADKVYGLLVDTGLMRMNETDLVKKSLDAIEFDNLHVEDASALFLERLHEVYEPEAKRKIIGDLFLEVKKNVSERMHLEDANWLLGQGTIYPDTIESGGTAHSSTIKTHHNRVDAITEMIRQGRVVEPLKELYKDEVRELGVLLGLPKALIIRHPFPGPGLGIRLLCAEKASLPDDMDQTLKDTLSVLPKSLNHITGRVVPVQSVGVQGDDRTYRHSLCLYTSSLKDLLVGEKSEIFWNTIPRFANASPEINRVVLCVSHEEPPAEFTFKPSYVTKERANLLRQVDQIVNQQMATFDLYEKIWQFPVAMAPFGLEGGECVILRPVASKEAMTAAPYRLPIAFLQETVQQLLKLDQIDMVVYDLTSKPPGTIEWE